MSKILRAVLCGDERAGPSVARCAMQGQQKGRRREGGTRERGTGERAKEEEVDRAAGARQQELG